MRRNRKLWENLIREDLAEEVREHGYQVNIRQVGRIRQDLGWKRLTKPCKPNQLNQSIRIQQLEQQVSLLTSLVQQSRLRLQELEDAQLVDEVA